MLKTLTPASLALATLLPVATFAEMAAKLDADGDGAVTMFEFGAAMPHAGAGLFAEIDTDADGVLSAEENGMLPAAATDG